MCGGVGGGGGRGLVIQGSRQEVKKVVSFVEIKREIPLAALAELHVLPNEICLCIVHFSCKTGCFGTISDHLPQT